MICFAWWGLPHYGAAGIKEFAKSANERITIIATKADVPQTVPDALDGIEIVWIEEDFAGSIVEAVGEYPRILIESGWSLPSFLRFVRETKAHGGNVITTCDHRHTGGLKEFLRAIRFRIKYRRLFDGMIVPGRSGLRLMKLYGMPRDRVASGLYTADNKVFASSIPIEKRSKTVLFVGRFDERKNVLRLIEAFMASQMHRDGWKLRCVGQGKLEAKMKETARGSAQIEILPFAQPCELRKHYCESRFFVLPSLEDHWGVVVHEAALSGCALALSANVGAADDLLEPGKNGLLFTPTDGASIIRCLDDVGSWNEAKLQEASRISREKANQFLPEIFAGNLSELIRNIS